MSQSPNIERELIHFLQTGQRLVQESYDARKTMLHTANAKGADSIIPTGLVRIRQFIHSGMIADSFLSDVLAHIGTLRDLLGRVKTLYQDYEPTYTKLEVFDKRCDDMSAWLNEWFTIREQISTDPRPPRAGAKRKTGRGNTTDTGKRGRGASLESLRGLYDDIDAKMTSVYEELKDSGVNRDCLALVQKARRVWPGDVQYFKQNIRKQIATILANLKRLLAPREHQFGCKLMRSSNYWCRHKRGRRKWNWNGKGGWTGTRKWKRERESEQRRRTAHGTYRTADALHAGDAAWREEGRMPQKADVSKLLRQKRQMCV